MAEAALPIPKAGTGGVRIGAGSEVKARAGLPTRLLYGLGSVAFGVKDNGFQTILLIFYNQVIGLPAALVGIAIMIALVSDAVLDPIIGQFSDNLRTPWGRRHPLMYASAIPLGVSYILLWIPPAASQGVQFIYLVVVAIIVRTFISLYEAPSAALSAELTTDYAERTSILGYRVFFAWFGGLAMSFLAFTVFLKPDADHKVGQLNPVGYAHYGLFAGILMITTILISAMGTHSRIKTFTVPPHRPMKIGRFFSETFASLNHRSFLVLLTSTLFSSAATGVAFSMALYFYTFYWGLSAVQISLFAVVNLVSAGAATALAKASSTRDKRSATIILFVGGLILSCVPITLRLFNAFPANGSPALFPILLGFSLIGLASMIAASIVAGSMIADVVEDSQLRTGRRSEGLFFAANAFVMKAVSGFGVFLSSAILTAVHFPAHAKAGAVDPVIIRNLALVYLPTLVTLYLIAAVCLLGYKITRQSHEANLKQLAEEGEAVPTLPGV